MKISIFGLGYVGVVTAALASQNNKVIGVDINPTKVSMVKEGISPIIEKGVGDLIKEGLKKSNLKATLDSKSAVLDSDVSVICVGTPSNDDGSHNLIYLHKVLKEISEILKEKDSYHLVVIRSTIPPGTSEELKEKYFRDLNVGLCFNPEFLREGVAVDDYKKPPYIVVACSDKKGIEVMKEFYRDVDAEFIVAQFKEAEVLKMVCNVFHALKVVFGNEIGRFCKAYGIDGNMVMDLVCKDKKLNISEKYLKPGFAYGGSCLPKDLRSFLHLAQQKNVDIPLILNIDVSNDKHIQHAIKRIEKLGSKKLGIVGLSFKPGTDDLRESPYVRLVEYFIGKGYDLKIYDPNISLAKLIGANKAYIEKEMPHISSLLVDNLSEFDDCGVIVLNRDMESDFKEKPTIKLI